MTNALALVRAIAIAASVLLLANCTLMDDTDQPDDAVSPLVALAKQIIPPTPTGTATATPTSAPADSAAVPPSGESKLPPPTPVAPTPTPVASRSAPDISSAAALSPTCFFRLSPETVAVGETTTLLLTCNHAAVAMFSTADGWSAIRSPSADGVAMTATYTAQSSGPKTFTVVVTGTDGLAPMVPIAPQTLTVR